MTEKSNHSRKVVATEGRQLIGSRTEVSSTTSTEMPAGGPRPKKK